ncbi:MAG: hypothetical protein MI739_11725 [Bacteroidales bacterium]|nr:hypothetical protein [Bacteroidales bacterium]
MTLNENNIQVKSSKKKGEKKVTITLKNDLTINNIEECKEEISKAFDKNQILDFKLKEIKNIDLTFIQFFYALKQESEKQEKKINFDTDFPQDVMALLNNTDLYKVFQIK